MSAPRKPPIIRKRTIGGPEPASRDPHPEPPRLTSKSTPPTVVVPAKERPMVAIGDGSGEALHHYTDDDISRLTAEGYIVIHRGLWDYLPTGCHIRYIRKDTGEGLTRAQRFRSGGYVKGRKLGESGQKMILLGKCPYKGTTPEDRKWYSIAQDSIETLWKQYDRLAFIEIHLIYNSLAQKKQQIEDLVARVERLERRAK